MTHKKEKCQYLLIEKLHCKLKANGQGICWKARGGIPEEKDCWVPKNQGVLKVL